MSFKHRTISFKRWAKGVFTKQPKVIIARPRPRKHSVITVLRNKIKRSKMDIYDIELLEGMDARHLQKQFSITGSRAIVLEKMVDDYNRGRLSIPGKSHKSKYNSKSLDKVKLNKMITQYNERSRDQIFDDPKWNAAIIKKKFRLSERETNKVEKLLDDLNKGKGSDVDLLRDLLVPERLTKDNLDKFLRQHEEARKKGRRISYLISQGRPSDPGPARRVSNLMENLKGLKGFRSKVIRKYEYQ